MTCSISGCFNTAFAQYDECALHCKKGKYQDDYRKGVLEEFFHLLKDHISKSIKVMKYEEAQIDKALNNTNRQGVRIQELVVDVTKILEERDEFNSELIDLIKKHNKYNEIILRGICFPDRKSRDWFDYFRILNLFISIHLVDCEFCLYNWIIKDVAFFFQNCTFHDSFNITPLSMLDNNTDSIFSECVFKSRVVVSADEKTEVFENSIFSGGYFNDEISFENVVLVKCPFLETSEETFGSIELKIFGCDFQDNFILEKVIIAFLWIEDTEFLLNVQITKSNINTFKCVNVTFTGMFDASESQIIFFNFTRVKFIDVADFEKVQFGSTDNTVIASYPIMTKFKFVTFMTASNFKKTKFYDGLDFEDVDLREQPNFLKSIINSKDTNRETFRIIKNSFDSRGNRLEGNRFFVQEMKAFRRELKKEGNNWDRLVYNINDLISEFGANYIRPTFILLASIILYTFIDCLHTYYFSTYDYFISSRLEPIWSFLNKLAKNFLPFSKFLDNKSGLEFISLLFYIWFAILIWQIIIAVKRHTQR